MVKHQRQVNPNEKLLLQLHKEGKSYKEIASLVSRSKSTIHYIIKKYNTKGNIANEQRSGRPRKLTPREEKLLLREIKERSVYICFKIGNNGCYKLLYTPNYVEECYGKTISMIESHERNSHISKKNKLLRLKFAKEYIRTSIFGTLLFFRMKVNSIYLVGE